MKINFFKKKNNIKINDILNILNLKKKKIISKFMILRNWTQQKKMMCRFFILQSI